jgi:SAM-dependent methyltransferase
MTGPSFARKLRNVVRGLLQVYGTGSIKKHLWNHEFARGRWDCLDSAPGDCVYAHVEKYARHGSILDVGCGSGSTGNELDASTYRHYTGVDISDAALEKARRRSAANGRADKNRYVQSDMLSYVPSQQYDVILFRDSIYYVPHGKITAVLNRYATYLKDRGVLIVRMDESGGKYTRIVKTIERSFEVVERSSSDHMMVLVIREHR